MRRDDWEIAEELHWHDQGRYRPPEPLLRLERKGQGLVCRWTGIGDPSLRLRLADERGGVLVECPLPLIPSGELRLPLPVPPVSALRAEIVARAGATSSPRCRSNTLRALGEAD